MASTITLGVIEQQIAGIIDDGTEAGALRAKLVRGDLVSVPFREGEYGIENVGVSASGVYQSADITANADGTNTGLYISVIADPTLLGKGVRVRFPFYGRAFGIRFLRDANASALSVGIDGRYYPLIAAGGHQYLELESGSLADTEAQILIDDDLPEGLHYADVTVVAATSGTRATVLYGYLVEERAGYRASPRYLNLGSGVIAPVAVPNAATTIPLGSGSGQLRAVRKILYTNVTAGAITVTVARGGVQMWKKSVPANDTVELDFGGLATVGILTHVASAAASVNYTLVGGR